MTRWWGAFAVLAALLVTASGCTPASPPPAPAAASPDPELGLIDGSYRFEVTENDMRAAGVADPREISENTGVFTFVFDQGQWAFEQEADHPVSSSNLTGSYTLVDGRVTIYWSQLHRDNSTSADVAVLDDGSLKFTEIVDAYGQQVSDAVFGTRPWQRLGPVPSDPMGGSG